MPSIVHLFKLIGQTFGSLIDLLSQPLLLVFNFVIESSQSGLKFSPLALQFLQGHALTLNLLDHVILLLKAGKQVYILLFVGSNFHGIFSHSLNFFNALRVLAKLLLCSRDKLFDIRGILIDGILKGLNESLGEFFEHIFDTRFEWNNVGGNTINFPGIWEFLQLNSFLL